MAVFEEFLTVTNTKSKKKIVLVGIRIDGHSREILSWALVKVAEHGDSVVAIHICRSSDEAKKKKPSLDDYLEVYQGLCSIKKVELSGQILTGSSARRLLVREAKSYGAVALVLGISKQSSLGSRISTAKYCAKRLSSTTEVLAIHNGKIVFRRCSSNELSGPQADPKPSLSTAKETPSEFADSEAETETVISICETNRSNDFVSLVHQERRALSRSDSLLSTDSISMDQKLGWPLLRRANSGVPPTPKARNISVVQWVMSLPERSPLQYLHCSTIVENTSLEIELNDFDNHSIKIRLSDFSEIPEGLESLFQTSSFGCKWFSLGDLKTSTSQFSSENLIGIGGCNHVYKGTLLDGKPVAIKILEPSKQGWKEFALEFDIVSSLKHKHITRLLGICVEDNALISVYDFLPRGSLEENLHGKNKDMFALSWEVRYAVAIGIAEALYYLHKECPQPVIHRDIKSSNILLSDEFEPQLSDFGLAIRAPKTTTFITEGDVVGTFGYLAPEYFMYGKVSDKIDVYAFGVVLLELLSGRRSIGSDSPKGQESLIMWAKPRLERRDVKGLLDPDLDGKVDEIQMKRMALAAKLCLTRSARLRPSISEILKILKGEEDIEKWANSKNDHQLDLENQDDEVYPNSSAGLHLGLALLDVDDALATSFSCTDRSHSLFMDEYFKGRWSRSSSFD
ncbi:Phosphorylase kinase, gamma catalytic subunit [Parasponia andersonii]|uniref:Phosphorylase kinase, gamma catalytic subunit n=1 Tax=Parasponia andersonii TaxID=3476 RepID=A0A2P5C9P5_PARAD|nr:Phosphorylase kinase, gamma catalytic subunit [Parasponia andersonii]